VQSLHEFVIDQPEINPDFFVNSVASYRIFSELTKPASKWERPGELPEEGAKSAKDGGASDEPHNIAELVLQR
jgi:hypothetical protein